LTALDIEKYRYRFPRELSGGQQQRVAIARTLAPSPSVIFMDEPLSNLDAKLRLEMRSELQRLHLTTGCTFVYVTHDQMEAMTLATRICLIENGVLQQYDAPLTVYGRPNNLFCADFVGNPSINFIEVNGKQGEDGTMNFSLFDGKKGVFTFGKETSIADFRVSEEAAAKAKEDELNERRASKKYVEKGNKDSVFKYQIHTVEEAEKAAEVTEDDYVVGVRPEMIEIREDGGLLGEVYSAMPTGMETTVRVKVGNYLLTGVVFGGITYEIGEKVHIGFKKGGIMLFSRKSGSLIETGSFEVSEA
ncbi:MAG: ABC transporter ATP-binding protein, partial [Clostridia bacterium]|nr:ABC transporter ATP-binding protein [Clostridia bacterium]